MERRELDSDGSWQEEPAKWTRRKAPLSILVQWLRLAVEAAGAIVVIRTGLNYFLMREMNEERVNGAYGTRHA